MSEAGEGTVAAGQKSGAWGWRLMPWDVPAVLLCGVSTWWAWELLGALALMLPLVLGHFFLFCNVFRVRRELELVWSAAFIVNVAVFLYVLEAPVFWQMALAQLPVTVVVIGAELRSWRYHGVAADRLNPQLERYLAWRLER